MKSLNSNISKIVLQPLERMIEKINGVIVNPLSILNKIKNKPIGDNNCNEMFLIERNVEKISKLLLLGFGQAGCIMIQKLLHNFDMEFDEVLSGQKIFGVFVFCDIRRFTDTSEVLMEDIMVFVNEIAEIVHSCADSCGGMANKNVGDAFLIVWRYNTVNLEKFDQRNMSKPR